ncbi:MAG: PD-(D/E)XK nuclease family protein [Cellulomonas sp.]|nr:PD-(D/E)XK nuclease family protein [Cellulomonas sp.]
MSSSSTEPTPPSPSGTTPPGRAPGEPRFLPTGRTGWLRLDGHERARVVDLKTGSQVTGPKAEANPQLAAYQLAVDAGAFEGLAPGTTSAGATLLYVGNGAARDGSRKEQSALDDGRTAWAHELIDGVADSMAASTFRATRNDDCRRCPVRSSCPVQPEGRAVTR